MQGWGLDFRTLVGNYINTMKTTFDLNCNSYQAWIHINIEVIRSCQSKRLLFDYL